MALTDAAGAQEGIIPGAANLRLAASSARAWPASGLAERRIELRRPEGRLICDEMCPTWCRPLAHGRAVDRLRWSARRATGAPSASRRSRSTGFRATCQSCPDEQAHCHFSPALIANLEKNWECCDTTRLRRLVLHGRT